VNVAVDEAEQLMNTEYSAYTHVSGKREEILVESHGWVSKLERWHKKTVDNPSRVHYMHTSVYSRYTEIC
jgi:hypothetical protein